MMQRGARSTPFRRGFTLIELVVVLGVILVLVGLVLAVSTVLIRRSEIRQVESMFEILTTAVEEFEQSRGRPLSYGKWVNNSPDRFDIPDIRFPGRFDERNDGNGRAALVQLLLDRLSSHGPSREILARIPDDMLRPVPVPNPLPPPQSRPVPCTQNTGIPCNVLWWQGPPTRPRLPTDGGPGPFPWCNPLPLCPEPGPAAMEIVDPWGTPIAVIFPGNPWVGEGERDTDGTTRTFYEDLSVFGRCANRRIRFVSAGPDRIFGTSDDIRSYSDDAR